MEIGGSDRISRLEQRVTRLEDILRLLGRGLGISGIDAAIDAPNPQPQPQSTTVVQQYPTKRR